MHIQIQTHIYQKEPQLCIATIILIPQALQGLCDNGLLIIHTRKQVWNYLGRKGNAVSTISPQIQACDIHEASGLLPDFQYLQTSAPHFWLQQSENKRIFKWTGYYKNNESSALDSNPQV